MSSLLTRSHVTIAAVGLITLLGVILFSRVLSPSASAIPTDSTQTLPNPSSASSPSDVVFPVEVAIARRCELVKSLTTNGTLRAKRAVTLVARVGGEIESISVLNGKYVKEGDLLVKLNDKEYRLVYNKVASLLLAAQIEYRALSTSVFIETQDTVKRRQQIQRAKEDLSLLEEHWRAKTITFEDYDRKKRDLETELSVIQANRSDVVASKSGLTTACEAYERAKVDLESTEIRAPISGYIADCDLEVGMRIAQQVELRKLVDLSGLYVDVEVLEGEVDELGAQRKTVVDMAAFPQRAYDGTICSINPIVSPKSKTVKVTVELTKLTGYGESRRPHSFPRPGISYAVQLVTDAFPNRLVEPRNALLLRDQRSVVFVVHNGIAKWQYVGVGEQNQEYVEITSGIELGDTVIVGGNFNLAHGARVTINSARKDAKPAL
jgi:RND family efflux transporter MFP subunit